MTPEDEGRTLVAEPPVEAAPAPVQAEPVLDPAAACPRCGTPLRPDQDWCLNCGAAARTRIAAPSGWRAPVAIVGAVLAIALAGLVVAFLAISDDSDELTRIAQRDAATATEPPPPPGAPTPAPTPPPEAPPPGATPEPTPDPAATEQPPVPTITPVPGEDGADPSAGLTPPTDGTTPPSDDPSSSDPSTGSGTIGSWPAGEDAFTVVLLSSPSRAGARKRARQLSANGTQVGVLDSDDFTSLRGGYWVVFSGQYDTRDAAESALSGLKSQSPGAYVRKVTPR